MNYWRSTGKSRLSNLGASPMPPTPKCDVKSSISRCKRHLKMIQCWDGKIILRQEENPTLGREANHAKATPRNKLVLVHESGRYSIFWLFGKCILDEIARSSVLDYSRHLKSKKTFLFIGFLGLGVGGMGEAPKIILGTNPKHDHPRVWSLTP